MFVVYYKADGKPKRYYHPEKGLQKTIKTAWAIPDAHRAAFEDRGLKCQTVSASPVAEMMYKNGVQYNKMKW